MLTTFKVILIIVMIVSLMGAVADATKERILSMDDSFNGSEFEIEHHVSGDNKPGHINTIKKGAVIQTLIGGSP